MGQEDLVQRILSDPNLLSALADKVYEKIREDVILKRIEGLEKAMLSLQVEMKAMREDFEKRFQALQESNEKRFQALEEENKRIWQEIARMREDFEKRFQALQEASEKRFQALEEENRKIWREIKLLRIAFSSFTSRAGHHIERTIMGLYKEALKLHGVEPSKVKHGKIVDEKGVVFKGREFEVDFYETDDYIYLFEVKNFADEGAIEQLEIKEKVFSSLYNKPVKKFLVANTIEAKVKREAEKRGITVIAGLVLKG